ncbi:MAG TPA: class I SAM-dependent methyltransferase [Clostridia bacterium]|nr:class I SAM-dependent methyltransferase [Clostridia bacterium]
MDDSLRGETSKLERSWMQHEAAKLRDYLVAGVEDPRINLQSIFSRHFILRALLEDRFAWLMEQECRFSAVMNWLLQFTKTVGDPEWIDVVLHAIDRNSDNAEGIEIPHFVLETKRELPAQAAGLTVEDYITGFLRDFREQPSVPTPQRAALNTFTNLWNEALVLASPTKRLSLIEPACGSANDYRFLEAFGIARHLDYAGFDLCPTNVSNARALFPRTRFEVGNAFELQVPARGFDLCMVHDLFEHLSPAGLEAALRELCRVARLGLCVGFFNMDEAAGHVFTPVDEYHWNTLSMERMKEAFAREGFAVRVLHVATFLRQRFGCEHTHNPNAYTFLCWRQ